MELLLYILGPLLLLLLPLMLIAGAVALGFLVSRSPATAIPALFGLVAATALVVPASAKFSSTNNWPAPWGMAVFFGPVEFSGRLFLFLLAVALGAFALTYGIQQLRRRRHRNAR